MIADEINEPVPEACATCGGVVPCSCVVCPACDALAPVSLASETHGHVCACGWRADRCGCGELFRFDAHLRGTTVGGNDLVGWGVCSCGATQISRRAQTADAVDWRLAKGGRSVEAGGIKLRAEKTDYDVCALMARIARVPELEAEVAQLRAELQRRAEPSRLERAALAIGDLFAAGIDPGWNEAQELEAAALEYRNAYRAREAKRAESKGRR